MLGYPAETVGETPWATAVGAGVAAQPKDSDFIFKGWCFCLAEAGLEVAVNSKLVSDLRSSCLSLQKMHQVIDVCAPNNILEKRQDKGKWLWASKSDKDKG